MDWNILGHEWAAQLLARHIGRQELRHAYLFTGAPGVGRRTLALRFAQAINCLQPPEPGQPCGTCRICRQIEKLQQADLLVLQSESEGAMLKIEQVRNLQHSLSLAPYEARYRVALLLRFQEANVNAQNALLKTLEEAPERAILLLTADSAESLLPTISSRCEIIRLRPLPVTELELALQTRWGLDAAAARRLAHLSNGRPGYALHLHTNPAELERRQGWLEDLTSLLAAPRRERFTFAEKAAKDKENLRRMYQVWLTFWRDVLLVASGSTVPVSNLDWEENIHQVADGLRVPQACARVKDLERGLQRLDGNLNPRLLTEVILLDWPRIKA